MSLEETKIERMEIRLLFLMTALAWLFSRKQFILFMQGLEPIHVLILWYVVMFFFVHFMLRGIGVSIGSFDITRWGLRHTLGSLAFIFGFFLVFNWCESQWASLALGGSGELPTIIIGTEDGALFSFWWSYFKNNLSFPYFIWDNAAEMAADFTYPLGTFVSFFIAVLLMSPKTIKKLLGRQAPEI